MCRIRSVLPVIVVGLVIASSALTACSRGDFEDRTAQVTADGSSQTYQLTSCGLDGTTVFLVGQAPGGKVLQAVVGVEPDHETGVPGSTGLSFGPPDGTRAAFGSESWQRRGEPGSPPGRITSARVRGSRIQATGTTDRVDAQGTPSPAADPQAFSLDARCDLET